MTPRRPCPPAPGPFEEYAARFERPLLQPGPAAGFSRVPDRLLAPRERNKTITCLAGAEPVTGARMLGVQRLRFFLSGSPWEAEQVNDRRLEFLREHPATAPHDGGVIVIDDSGDRKDGHGHRPRGPAVAGPAGHDRQRHRHSDTTVWTDDRVYYRCTPRPTPPPITSPAAAPTRPSARNRSWLLLSRPAGR